VSCLPAPRSFSWSVWFFFVSAVGQSRNGLYPTRTTVAPISKSSSLCHNIQYNLSRASEPVDFALFPSRLLRVRGIRSVLVGAVWCPVGAPIRDGVFPVFLPRYCPFRKVNRLLSPPEFLLPYFMDVCWLFPGSSATGVSRISLAACSLVSKARAPCAFLLHPLSTPPSPIQALSKDDSPIVSIHVR